MNVTSISAVIGQFELQSRLFNNVVIGIDNDQGAEPLLDHINPPVWIAGHIVSTRTLLATLLGAPIEEPFPKFFANGKKYDPELTYPPFGEITQGWDKASEQLFDRLGNLSEDELGFEPPIKTPMGEYTMRAFVAFIAHHESYHIGQLDCTGDNTAFRPCNTARVVGRLSCWS